MNKRLIKVLLVVISFFMVQSVRALGYLEKVNYENNYKVLISDDADLLTSDEVDKLIDVMYPLTNYGNIAFVTISSNSSRTSVYASNFYHRNFGTESGTLFIIDMDNRQIYIFSDGYNYKFITNSKADIITDNIYRYASDREYYECAKEAFREIETVLSGGKIAEPMRYISNILISITIAFILNFLIVLFKTKIRKASNAEILKKCNIEFNMTDFNAVKSGTHRVYSPVSSDSGGSSGGGGGGGGGSSGGGGGHSF